MPQRKLQALSPDLRHLSDPEDAEVLLYVEKMRLALLLVVLLAGTLDVMAEQPYRIGGSVSPPQVVSKKEPEYTPEALAARREGAAMIVLVVTSDGLPSDVHEISQPLGYGLDEKAVEAAQQWRFRPGEKNGRPVDVIVQIELNFHLPH
jgi:TonB family protein